MSTNETKFLEPINYIIMHAIYQHFYELKKVSHREDCELKNGTAVEGKGLIELC